MTVHAYSRDNCPECGVQLARPWDGDRPRLNHAPGSKACKVRAWARDAQDRDLVQVSGAIAVELSELGVEIVYGPTAAGPEDKMGLLATARVRSAFVASAFVPRWAFYLHDTMPSATLPRTKARIERAISRCQSDPEFAAAMSSTGMLCTEVRERRAAILELVRG
jgi:hypothetical protein